MRLLGFLLMFSGILLLIHASWIESRGVVHVAGRYQRQGRQVIERESAPAEFRQEMGPRWLVGGVVLLAGLGVLSLLKKHAGE